MHAAKSKVYKGQSLGPKKKGCGCGVDRCQSWGRSSTGNRLKKKVAVGNKYRTCEDASVGGIYLVAVRRRAVGAP